MTQEQASIPEAAPTLGVNRAAPLTPLVDLGRPVRFTLVQPGLPKYRIPAYRAIAQRPRMQFKLVYAQDIDLPNAEPDGFAGEFGNHKYFFVRGRPIFWHTAQLREAWREPLDVVGFSWNTRYLSLLPAMILARLRGVPVLLFGHGYSKNEGPFRAWARRWLGKRADAIVVYNRTTRENLIKRGMNPQRVYVALNTVDQNQVQAARSAWIRTPGKVEEFKRREGLGGPSGTAPVLLFVSRLEEANRVDMLLDAAAQLRSTHPHMRVIIIGKGPDDARLRAHAARLGLTPPTDPTVRFLGAIYNEEIIAGWFLSSDVFCYPANIGLSLLHAFGYGLPAVTCDNFAAQNPEIEALRPGENGAVYKQDSVPDLVRVLNELFSDRVRLRAMSECAHRTATEEYSIEGMADGFIQAVNHCLHKHAK